MQEADEYTGLVLRSTGAHYRVQLEDGAIVDAGIRGKLRLQAFDTTNPVAVGDRVRLEWEEGAAVVTDIAPRQNYILRKATKSSSQRQILCANIDQAVLIFTIQKPYTPLNFVDRFLVMAGAYHIPVIILFNKIDLLKKAKDVERLRYYLELYDGLGYPVKALSATHDAAPTLRTELANLFRDKITFLAGVSGAGKSTLANLIDPSLKLKTGQISEYWEKGRHTTTFASMASLSFGGAVVDAPGVKEFQLIGLEPCEVAHYMPEMLALLSQCRFADCTHTSEPDCAVIAAVQEGRIAEIRYQTYVQMLEDLNVNPY